MPLFAQQDSEIGLAAIVFLFVGACILTWVVFFERLYFGIPTLPYRPRRRVPWVFFDLLAVILFYFAIAILVINIAEYFITLETLNPSTDATKTTTAHPIAQLMAAKNWYALALSMIFGVIIAPIAEELFFRVLLQGWLENIDRKLRRRLPVLWRIVPRAAMPIFISSVIFAGQHYREAGPAKGTDYLTHMMTYNAIIILISLLFAIAWMRIRAGATAADLGWDSKKLFADIRLGLITFVAVAPPIYVVQLVLLKILPEQYAPDPISIFLFAIALGFLYYRTHRAAPSIALHMALNSFSLILVLIFGE